MADVNAAIYVWATTDVLLRLRGWFADELEEPPPALTLGAPFLACFGPGDGRYRPYELGPVSGGGGQALGVLLDEYGQLVYDHWVDGRRARGLTCYPEGSGWDRVEGEPEPWEAALFDERAREALGWGLPAPRQALVERVFAERRLVRGAAAPRPREEVVWAALDAAFALPPREPRSWWFW